jgi:hypothetical protein
MAISAEIKTRKQFILVMLVRTTAVSGSDNDGGSDG